MSGGAVTKKIVLYRNGDPSFRPYTYIYSNRKTKNFDQLLSELERFAPPLRGGALQCLYTPRGSRKIDDLPTFETIDSDRFVAVGSDGFKPIRGGYDSIGNKENRSDSAPQEDYREINKRQYDSQRTDDQRIENRTDVGIIKKIQVYRSGDPHYKPQPYFYRSKNTRTWEQFLEDVHKICPPMRGGPLKRVYTVDGIEIYDFDEIEANEGYVFSGFEGYRQVKGGYLAPEIGTDKYGNQKNKQSSQRANNSEKNRDLLMNRKDQTHPEPVFLFVFRNGEGFQATRMLFTPKQLDRGMPFVLEQIAKRFDIYARRLTTMDGLEITSIGELVNKGAYVVLALGESFRDTWYYLPEGSVDTSAPDEDGEEDPNDPRALRYGERPPSAAERDKVNDRRDEDARPSSRKSYGSDPNSRRRTPTPERYENDARAQDLQDDYRGRAYTADRDYDRQQNGYTSSRPRADSVGRRDQDRLPRPNERYTNQPNRSQNFRSNVRSISPSPNRGTNRDNRGYSNGYTSQNNRPPPQNQYSNQQRSNQPYQERRNVEPARAGNNTDRYGRQPDNRRGSLPFLAPKNDYQRAKSEDNMFYSPRNQGGYNQGRNNQSQNNRPRTIDYDRDNGGVYRSKGGYNNQATYGAKPVKDSRQTKTDYGKNNFSYRAPQPTTNSRR